MAVLVNLKPYEAPPNRALMHIIVPLCKAISTLEDPKGVFGSENLEGCDGMILFLVEFAWKVKGHNHPQEGKF